MLLAVSVLVLFVFTSILSYHIGYWESQFDLTRKVIYSVSCVTGRRHPPRSVINSLGLLLEINKSSVYDVLDKLCRVKVDEIDTRSLTIVSNGKVEVVLK